MSSKEALAMSDGLPSDLEQRPESGVERSPSSAVMAPPREQGSLELASLWQDLLQGRRVLTKSFIAAGRCFAVVREACNPAIPARLARTLQSVLRGESQKSLAYKSRVSASTVAQDCALALKALTGSPDGCSRCSVLLVIAAHAEPGGSSARLEGLAKDEGWVVSMELPGGSLKERLSPAEWRVVRLTIEGKTHLEMARTRRTSRRTVANQIASAYRKLGISGRCALRALAVREDVDSSSRRQREAMA